MSAAQRRLRMQSSLEVFCSRHVTVTVEQRQPRMQAQIAAGVHCSYKPQRLLTVMINNAHGQQDNDFSSVQRDKLRTTHIIGVPACC